MGSSEVFKRKGKSLKMKGLPAVRWMVGLGVFLFCFGLCVFSFQPAQAQTLAEWFSQKKTLVKYLGQQIAALEAFDREVKQGYALAKSDWGMVANFKDGELGLHKDYYAALQLVSPQVKAATDVASLQSEVQSVESQFNGLKGLAGLSAGEQAYVNRVGSGVLAACNADLSGLHTVLSPGGLSMTDADRMVRINRLSASIKDAYLFSCSFCSAVRTLVVQRGNNVHDPGTLMRLYGTGD
ncbi:hypothetical protein KXD93_22560 [Mucilaginibacter sp. BJC16-A38]|uniref:hypothetical protein n=1 Tax=Mucilaginibacter phenanthrenivorans TaxID=1234842 RepID=UPI0021578ED8|nr:hypothetical protein [Mucilaginibacter phenanthrenivorans]MCR8560454.1 hypothetical protein [Mucilaginibacter phenanthrenivorans]